VLLELKQTFLPDFRTYSFRARRAAKEAKEAPNQPAPVSEYLIDIKRYDKIFIKS